jgi:translation initiation factor 1 (eIF-1/SUI1)
MDLFLNELNNNTILNDNKITVFCVKSGRRYNTYIVGWDETDDKQKKTLEYMKKYFGCGGTIKNIVYQGAEMRALNLQGNWVIQAGDYLKSLKLKNLIIKDIF